MNQGSWGSGGGGGGGGGGSRGWGPSPGSPNPYTPPGFAPTPAGYPPGYTPEAAGAVAWEDSRLPLFSRWWATTKAVCFSPGPFYEAASKSENMGSAIGFAAMSAAIGGLFLGIYYALLMFLGAGFLATLGKGMGKDGEVLAAVYGGMGVVYLVITPIQAAFTVVMMSFVLSGIQHGVLMLFRGATKPYASTYRVVAYTSATHIFNIVPLLGPLISAVWSMVVGITGLDATHKSGTGKALAAVGTPLLLLCCCVGLIVAFAVALFGTAAAHP